MRVLRKTVIVMFAWLACTQAFAHPVGKPGETESAKPTAVTPVKEEKASTTKKTPTEQEILVGVVREATEKVINLLKDERGIYKKDENAFFNDVKKIIDPVISYKEFAKGVMGKHLRDAKGNDLAEFTSVFRDSLLHFYSKAVLSFDSNQLSLASVAPVSAEAIARYKSEDLRHVEVNLTIRSKETDYSMSYFMIKEDNTWKARNFSVEGINMGFQLRNQYAEAFKTYKTVKDVTANWSNVMQQSEQNQKKSEKRKG